MAILDFEKAFDKIRLNRKLHYCDIKVDLLLQQIYLSLLALDIKEKKQL